jgi:anti-sigma B factor antagonist
MVSSVLSSDGVARGQRAAPLVSHDGNRTVVWLDGEHDISTLLLLTDTLATAIAADAADLVVDLSGVTFIGAATINELIRGRTTLRHQSRSLTLRSPSRCAQRLLDVCGLRGLVEPSCCLAL